MRSIDGSSTISFVPRWLAAVALCAATACSIGHGDRASESASARALVGAWDASFRRTDPLPGRPRDSVPPTVRGVLAFVPGRHVAGADELPDPTHAGTFAVDFAPLGFEPGSLTATPAAIARAWGRDSVVLLLGPYGDGPGVSMRGALAGDSIVGTWTLVSTRMLGASGTFTMTRHRGGGR